MQMTLQMITLCKEKCLKRSHTDVELSSAESTAIGNCMKKYLEAPQIVMAQMQQAGGASQGGF